MIILFYITNMLLPSSSQEEDVKHLYFWLLSDVLSSCLRPYIHLERDENPWHLFGKESRIDVVLPTTTFWAR